MTSVYQFLSAVPKQEFRDFDLSMAENPVTGDLLSKDTEGSIKQALRNIILTNFYEVPFNPTQGGQITGAIFEFYTQELEIFLRKELSFMIQVFEPRVVIRQVTVGYNESTDTVRARVEFTIIGRIDTSVLDLFFERVR